MPDDVVEVMALVAAPPRCATCHRAGQKPSSIHTLLLVTLPSMAR